MRSGGVWGPGGAETSVRVPAEGVTLEGDLGMPSRAGGLGPPAGSSRTGGPPCRSTLMRIPTASISKSKLEPP